MTTAQSAPERKTLRQLRETADTLFAKNNTPNKITCNTDKVSFELDPYEIAIMPKECLHTPGMQRLWMRKAVTISDDEALENEIILHMGGMVEMTGPRPIQVLKDDGTWTTETPIIEEVSGRRDIVMKVDDDPTSRTYGMPQTLKCVLGGELVFLTKQQLDEGRPPLCPTHESDAHRIVSIQNPDGSWSHKLPTIER
jgi:hypothetical protein